MTSTDDLKQELMSTPDLDGFLSQYSEDFSNANAHEMLEDLFNKKKISKASLAKLSGMSEIYLYQVFSGRRNPSRNRLLCLCFGLGATIDETQELLKQCGYAQLYAKNRRDAIIIYGIVNGVDLFAINDKLFEENEDTLY
jgi:transcriptional regulator with XRE-family HTH domain